MAIFPYEDDEERRRRMLPPPIALPPPLPRSLPNIPAPTPRPLSAPGIPAGVVPGGMPGMPARSPLPETVVPERVAMSARTPNILPGPSDAGFGPAPVKTRPHQIEDARQDHLAKTPGRLKSGLLNAAKGALTGLATGGGLGAALGGAVGGGAFGAISPRNAQDADFSQRVKPKLLERFAYEDADRAAQMQAAKAAGDQAMTQAQLANINSQIGSRDAGDRLAREKEQREANAPLVLNPGQVAVDRRTQKEFFKVPTLPKPPTSAELTIEPSSGKSFEQIAEESYQNKGGDEYVFSKLPERTRRLLNGEVKDASPQEIESANRAFQDAINRQRKTDLDYTRGDVRGRALGARQGGSSSKPVQRKGQPGRRAISVAEAAELLK